MRTRSGITFGSEDVDHQPERFFSHLILMNVERFSFNFSVKEVLFIGFVEWVCFCGRHVGDCILFLVLFFPNLLSFSFSVYVSSESKICSHTNPSLSPLSLLQVLKPLSEHYMEDSVRQTVVNSLKASLTEQASQHTKLKTHWRSSSSSSSSCSSPSHPLAHRVQP